LLKVFSKILDTDASAGKAPPRQVLDSGCGAGIIGICVAAALSEQPHFSVRCQDRDELARLVTLHNAAKNRIPPQALMAFTEPLLAGPEGGYWDLILSNVPAKAGTPVLEDFVRRSACLLNPGGRVIIVAVNTLADFFREHIKAAGAELALEEKGPGHTVFVYGGTVNPEGLSSVNPGPEFMKQYPFYRRAVVDFEKEEIPLHIETVYGAPGFDSLGGAASAAVKLASGLITGRSHTKAHRTYGSRHEGEEGNDFSLLIHEPGQGFFPCLLLGLLYGGGLPQIRLVLSGRNILALEAAAHNVRHNMRHITETVLTVPAADLNLGREAQLEAAGGRRYGCIVAFPELLPQSALPKTAKGSHGPDQLSALWDSLPPLLAEGGLFLAAFGSSEAERFDRKKPAGFTRLGSIKREGFRALGYEFLGYNI
jgi:hypothetical protein